ncbi:hypothetical protein C3V05_005409 [Escherichia coli]|nr:hypothetical protein [Escherichia coli]
MFVFNTLTLCTIGLIHLETEKEYVVVFTDNNNIRDYKTGIVPQFGEMKQSDIDLILFCREEYEKYFDGLKTGDEALNIKEYIECMQ